MSLNELSKEQLIQKLEFLELENNSLKQQLGKTDGIVGTRHHIQQQQRSNATLTAEEYRRYGRQMQVPEIGISTQRKLKQSKVLVIGAGRPRMSSLTVSNRCRCW
ncbi:unnamed protein product [Ambrosiozyma monospora]|uniref:Unnamed protein product n=1 Tax=Ambrosiozyma monospora TaxID=43982 RepID=A0ACB5TG34_AMBMO|nr:unnamed protein product [Ambrosiozyma monospora]